MPEGESVDECAARSLPLVSKSRRPPPPLPAIDQRRPPQPGEILCARNEFRLRSENRRDAAQVLKGRPRRVTARGRGLLEIFARATTSFSNTAIVQAQRPLILFAQYHGTDTSRDRGDRSRSTVHTHTPMPAPFVKGRRSRLDLSYQPRRRSHDILCRPQASTTRRPTACSSRALRSSRTIKTDPYGFLHNRRSRSSVEDRRINGDAKSSTRRPLTSPTRSAGKDTPPAGRPGGAMTRHAPGNEPTACVLLLNRDSRRSDRSR